MNVPRFLVCYIVRRSIFKKVLYIKQTRHEELNVTFADSAYTCGYNGGADTGDGGVFYTINRKEITPACCRWNLPCK